MILRPLVSANFGGGLVSMRYSNSSGRIFGLPLSPNAHSSRSIALRIAAFTAGALISSAGAAAAFGQANLTLQITDYVAAPQTGTTIAGALGNSSYVARINFMKEEPGRTNGYWINDLNGPLYFYDKASKTFTEYLNFNGADGHPGIFHKLAYSTGYGGGLITFQFHPEYWIPGSAHYGVFYTVHMEDPTQPGSALPDNSSTPGLNLTGYQNTPVVPAPGPETLLRQSVLIEWRDNNPRDKVFTGTARELLRVEVNNRLHPMGDLLFNPLAILRSHPDYGNMYISLGDGGDGETNQAERHPNPQALSTLLGKILRINPDDPDGAGPLTYGIPTDNPFVSTAGARGEIWAYGFRNPHRFSWDIFTNRLIVNDIGFHSWEEVDFVKKGQNYGWANREGAHVFDVTTGTTSPLPVDDSSLGYQYPVIEYPHVATPGYPSFGDAISNGFVYRGIRFPALFGKYIFADITTGELYYADYGKMLAADDGDPATRAPYYKFLISWDSPLDSDNVPETYQRMYEIVEAGYEQRGGPHKNLPGSAANSGTGRADVRLVQAWDGEIYIMSKSDGMIRRVSGVMFNTPVPATNP